MRQRDSKIDCAIGGLEPMEKWLRAFYRSVSIVRMGRSLIRFSVRAV